MGADSKIEWTHHTFNPWRGCTKVSEGCKFCYALDLSKRNPAVLGIWGPKGTRVVATESYWRQPLKWNKAAEQAGERHRVFCASLADVFEGPETMPSGAWTAVDAARERLFGLIAATPNLDWLLLTKRPQNAAAYLAWDGHDRIVVDDGAPCNCLQCRIVRSAAAIYGGERSPHYGPMVMGMAGYLWQNWPLPNVWIGTSVENQAAADERIPHLLKVPARVRFLSCEPLLGPVDLARWVRAGGEPLDWTPDGDAPPGDYNPVLQQWETRPDDGGLHWVIVGGESGAKARPMHPEWARSLRDQCQAAGVAFHFKQHGEWVSEAANPYGVPDNSVEPEQCRWLAYDGSTAPVGSGAMRSGDALVYRAGKVKAGRSLDGRTWDELPL